MASIPDLVTYIRFQLSELAANNAHHEFEHLCRHLTRHRICSNILPATGPVAAGGDQGRDFETFRTYLATGPLAASAFVGLVSDRPLVFQVSLQQRILQKMRADIKTVAASGRPVEGVHYFCAASVPVARRHQLQQWAKATHGIDLEIYDGPALAEMLADREVLWIASQFLGVPAEMYPEPPMDSAEPWYEETLLTWQSDAPPLPTFAAFAMVKAAVRHATSVAERSADLPFWFQVLNAFGTEDSPMPLRFRATYERAVASLRGHGTMEGLEGDLRIYFAGVPGFVRVADLEDAACLAVFCHEARHRNALNVSLVEILGWRDLVVRHVDGLLDNAHTLGHRAELLALRGHLEVAQGLNKESGPETMAQVMASTVEWWRQAAELANEAPLFPLERFADQLAKLAALIGDAPGYGLLTRRVDDLLARRVGDAAVARRARERALTFCREERLLRAVVELHEAKVRWFARETLEESALSMLFVARIYQDLGLYYAAKYYALAAAGAAGSSDDPDVLQLLPRALAFVGDCDYRQGNWIAFLRVTSLAVVTHWQFARVAGDFDANPELERFGVHSAIAVAVCERLDPRVAERFREVVAAWGHLSWLEEILPSARKAWDGLTAAETLIAVEEKLEARVLGDIEPEREVAWEQLGMTWRLRWQNVGSVTTAAEQFVAVLQIVLTELALHDLLLLRTEIEVDVTTADIKAPLVDPLPSNSGRRWKAVLPCAGVEGSEATARRTSLVLGAAAVILREVSLLPDEQFLTVLQRLQQEGVFSKILVGRSFEQLAREFGGDPKLLANLLVRPMPRAKRTPVAPAHPELRWIDGPGLGWSKDEALEAVARRYAHAAEMLPLTLARLRQSADFHRAVEMLRLEGWKDWHLLLAVGNVTWNYRGFHLYGPHGLSDQDVARRIAYEPEDDASLKVPTDEYAEDRLRTALRGSMLHTLQQWGLELRQDTPDFPAIEDFLAHRYRYWDIDIEHDDPFASDIIDSTAA